MEQIILESKPWAADVNEEDILRRSVAVEDDKQSAKSSKVSKKRKMGKDGSRWSSQQSLLSVDTARGFTHCFCVMRWFFMIFS